MISIRNAKPSDMDKVFEIALKYDLDSNDMDYKDFIIAEDNNKIAGFGRLWKHDDAIELGTVGVVEEYRGKKVAEKIIKELLNRTDKDVYLTTLIPGFFEKFGFKMLDVAPPQSMIRKKEWCEGCTKVGCTVMKLSRS